MGFSITYHPFWGTPIYGNPHVDSSSSSFGCQKRGAKKSAKRHDFRISLRSWLVGSKDRDEELQLEEIGPLMLHLPFPEGREKNTPKFQCLVCIFPVDTISFLVHPIFWQNSVQMYGGTATQLGVACSRSVYRASCCPDVQLHKHQ